MSGDVKTIYRAFITKSVRSFDLADHVDLFDSGIVDSLFAAELVAFTEQEFDVIVEDEDLDMDNFRSIDALAGFVNRKLGSVTSGP